MYHVRGGFQDDRAMGQPPGRGNAGCYQIRAPRTGAFGVTGSQAERGCLAASDSAAFLVALAALCAYSAGFLSEFPSLGPLPELEDIDLRHVQLARDVARLDPFLLDRKSTRLNSSHLGISYA